MYLSILSLNFNLYILFESKFFFIFFVSKEYLLVFSLDFWVYYVSQNLNLGYLNIYELDLNIFNKI